MGQPKLRLVIPSILLSCSLSIFAEVGAVRADAAATEATPVAQAEAVQPAAPPADQPPTPPATPKCECPPPCPAAPPPPAAPTVEWKAQSKGGMLISTGNAEAKSFTFGVNGSRKEGSNKLALEGGLAYGTADVLVLTQNPAGVGTASRESITSTNNWASKVRYDRFITNNNSAFVSGLAAGDEIAGKTFFGGGEVGYSRQLRKDKWNIVVAELGYDFSYQRYVQPGDGQPSLDPITVHSARVFAGETLSLSKETGITASVEGLFNLNKESKAVSVNHPDPADPSHLGVDAFKDTRLNGKIGLSTNLWDSLSFGFSFTVKYDENPAPRPSPQGAPSTFAFPVTSPYYFADKVDTLTEATLIYTFF